MSAGTKSSPLWGTEMLCKHFPLLFSKNLPPRWMRMSTIRALQVRHRGSERQRCVLGRCFRSLWRGALRSHPLGLAPQQWSCFCGRVGGLLANVCISWLRESPAPRAQECAEVLLAQCPVHPGLLQLPGRGQLWGRHGPAGPAPPFRRQGGAGRRQPLGEGTGVPRGAWGQDRPAKAGAAAALSGLGPCASESTFFLKHVILIRIIHTCSLKRQSIL